MLRDPTIVTTTTIYCCCCCCRDVYNRGIGSNRHRGAVFTMRDLSGGPHSGSETRIDAHYWYAKTWRFSFYTKRRSPARRNYRSYLLMKRLVSVIMTTEDAVSSITDSGWRRCCWWVEEGTILLCNEYRAGFSKFFSHAYTTTLPTTL